MSRDNKQFQINEDVNLIFTSDNKAYQLRLCLSGGLLFLKQLEERKEHDERIIFLDDSKHYTGENVSVEMTKEVTKEVTENKEKPKRKRKKKK